MRLEARCSVLVVLAISLVLPATCRSHQTQLSHYDSQVSSSSLGEPVFRLEPPNVINFANTQGATILCLASGSPRPTITWHSGSNSLDQSTLGPSLAGEPFNRPVENVTNLRQILQNGAALRLLPFRESNYRQDIHSTEYKCTASNRLGTIHSRAVQVQATVTSQRDTIQAPELKVSDEFATLNSVAVLRCKLSIPQRQQYNPTSLASWLLPPLLAGSPQQQQPAPLLPARESATSGEASVANNLAFEWLTGEGVQVASSADTSKALVYGKKFAAFGTGELHINGVEIADLQRTYGCRLRNNSATGMRNVVASSNFGQLIATDASQQFRTPEQLQQAITLHTVGQLIDWEYSGAERQQWSAPRSSGGSGIEFQPAEDPQLPSSSSPANERRILALPCAVRAASAQQQSGQWLFQASSPTSFSSAANWPYSPDEAALPLAQWAAAHSIPIVSAGSEQLAALSSNESNVTSAKRARLASGGTNNNNVNYSNERNPQLQQQASRRPRFLVGSSYLAIEWPSSALSGRYRYQVDTNGEHSTQTGGPQVKTMCDINVIIRQSIKLRMAPILSVTAQLGGGKKRSLDSQSQSQSSSTSEMRTPLRPAPSAQPIMASSASHLDQQSWLRRALDWFWSEDDRPYVRRERRSSPQTATTSGQRNPLIELDPRRLQVSGPGLVMEPPIARVGDRMELQCRGSGHPIDGVKWFKNGQAINTQSSQDFQIEISTPSADASMESADSDDNRSGERLLSSLVIRQLQPRDSGPQIFECFAHNFLGEQARAGQLVYVAERRLISWARSQCPMTNTSSDEVDESSDLESAAATTDKFSPPDRLATFRRNNPLKKSLVLENELVELRCPQASGRTRRRFGMGASGEVPGQQRVEWRRIAVGEQLPQMEGVETVGGSNQLFAGDSRFVMNGSSLQIRAPSKRHDEATYFCSRKLQPPQQQEQMIAGAVETQDGADVDSEQASELDEMPEDDLMLAGVSGGSSPASMFAQSGGSVHQSSSAAGGGSQCRQLLASSGFFRQEQQPQELQQGKPASQGVKSAGLLATLQTSSISIRIVAKPKIDPFEFSRNLEEGMRAVAVCAVISGQSPVDITWFKDGEPLLASEQVSLDQANGFSSTLTFHRIKPSHSGLYTCVAANAYASSKHSSRLLVNVAPYFIEPPKSAQAILNSNLLVDCRAGGQPNPQIRWRKLVAVGQNNVPPSGQLLGSPLGGASSKLMESALANQPDGSQVALLNPQSASGSSGEAALRHEFRIITSNSHIQILENGSMIIKDVELSDASQYACQAFNGINPSLSELIDIQVLSPAQFGVSFETVSVKRDSVVKFNCAPRGDQPMRIEWFKETNRLVATNASAHELGRQQSKYNELVHLNAGSANSSESGQQQRVNTLVPRPPVAHPAEAQKSLAGKESSGNGILSSELFINYADRSDTGTFVCVASNPIGKDELTYRLVVQEPPDVPLNVQVQNVQATSLKLSWTAPFDGNLAISHFVIEYRKLARDQTPLLDELNPQQLSSKLSQTSDLVGRHSEWVRLLVATNKLISDVQQQHSSNEHKSGAGSLGPLQMSSGPLVPHNQLDQQQMHPLQYAIQLHQLSAKSNYHLRVAAVNAIGQGGFSSVQSVTTAEEPPNGKANDVRAQPVSSSSIKVLWRGPAIIEEQAPIKGYHLSYRKLQAGPLSKHDSTGALGVQLMGQANQAAATSQLWIATVSVSADNGTLYQSSTLTAEQFVSAASGSSKLVSNGPQSQLQAHLGANYEYQVNNLEKNTKYEIRVQPYNSMGVGPASDTIGQTLKFDRPGQPNLKLVEARKQSLELKWSVADDQPLMGFLLYYKCEYDDWQEIQLASIYHYVIENLRCGNKYQVYLSAFNVVGRSDPSDVLSVRTEGTVPIAPDKSQFFKANITELVLDMLGWQSGGCPISSFMIQFKRLHDSNWFILSEGSSSFANSEKITIPDLTPATWYKLLVTAVNEAGSTNAEYLFSTLNTNGEQIAPDFPADFKIGNDKSTGRSSSMLSSLSQLLFSNGVQQHNQAESHLLLPMSCILLLLVTSLASYLYYSRSLGPRSQSSTSSSTSTSLKVCSNGGIGPDEMGLDRSPSLLLHNLQQVPVQGGYNGVNGSMTLGHAGLSEDNKRLLHHQALMGPGNHYAANGHNTLPHNSSASSAAAACGDQSNLMMDTLMNAANNVHLQSFVRQQRARNNSLAINGHGGGLTPSNCTNSSSVSTHSTSCHFDGSSSQTSSGSAPPSAGGKTSNKLQLIDESPMMGERHNLSPTRAIFTAAGGQGHVDMIDQQAIDSLNEQLIADANNFANLFNYAQLPQRQIGASSSFASGADLLQRQQQQACYSQQHDEMEPIYQRLDKFQNCNLATCKQSQAAPQHFVTIAPRSQTLRFVNSSHFSLDDSQVNRNSAAMHRSSPLKSHTQQRGGEMDYTQNYSLMEHQQQTQMGADANCFGQDIGQQTYEAQRQHMVANQADLSQGAHQNCV